MSYGFTDKGWEFMESLPENIKADINMVLNDEMSSDEFWLKFAIGFGFETTQEMIGFIEEEADEEAEDGEYDEEMNVGDIMIMIALLFVQKEAEKYGI